MKPNRKQLLSLFAMLFVAASTASAQQREVRPRSPQNSRPSNSRPSQDLRVTPDDGTSAGGVNLSRTRQVAPRGQRPQADLRVAPGPERLDIGIAPTETLWLLGIVHDPAPGGVRVRSVRHQTPATRLIGFAYNGQERQFRLEPGDYIVDINGHPLGLHNGVYCDFGQLLNHCANHPDNPNDFGWVNLGIFDPNKLTVDEFWVQLQPR